MTDAYGSGSGAVIEYMTYQKVNVTNYTHRNAKERAHSNITYGVGIFILQPARLKNVMSGDTLYTCQLSGCYNKIILKFMCV